jgi:hypothetical protein
MFTSSRDTSDRAILASLNMSSVKWPMRSVAARIRSNGSSPSSESLSPALGNRRGQKFSAVGENAGWKLHCLILSAAKEDPHPLSDSRNSHAPMLARSRRANACVPANSRCPPTAELSALHISRDKRRNMLANRVVRAGEKAKKRLICRRRCA